MPLDKQDIDYVMNELRIKLTGASDAGIKQAMWGVIKEFLSDSNAWTECQRLMVTAGTQQYFIAPKEGGQIIRLSGVLDGNRSPVRASMPNLGTLDICTPIQVTSVAIPGGTTGTGSNFPWYVGIVKNITFPATRDSIPIAPDFVLKVYSKAIIDGVLGNMMMDQAKSYTNVPLAKYYLQRFRDEIGIARNEARMQNIFGAERWRFPGFASGSQRGGNSTGWPQGRV